MKQKLSSAFTLVVCLFVLLSCKDEDSKPKNEFTYNGQGYAIAASIVFVDDEPSDTDAGLIYQHDLAFLPGTFVVAGDDFTGKGSFVIVGLHTKNSAFATGVYTINPDEDVLLANEARGRIGIGVDSEDEDAGDFYNLESGKITVESSGSSYTVTIDAVANGKPVKGYFSGTISQID